jgi:hypothetical protein
MRRRFKLEVAGENQAGEIMVGCILRRTVSADRIQVRMEASFRTVSILCRWTGSLLRRNCVPHVDTRITTLICLIGNGNVLHVAHSMVEISMPPSTSKVKV